MIQPIVFLACLGNRYALHFFKFSAQANQFTISDVLTRLKKTKPDNARYERRQKLPA